ncbi:SagB family peptide dehydrogenase [Micromonospora sp. NPDC092111]|uniref:SagB family peptide dehydrogenase n=1 Tax=Micromonospora sp. NPDC092111 TaxID=3364289 RepID=UPI0037F86A2E
MQHSAIEVVRDYAEAVFRRAREPMEPLGYEVNWTDQPSRHKTYPGARRLPLAGDPPTLATLRELLTGAEPPAGGGWTLDRLATLLRLSYGVLDRRLVVNWNQDIDKRVHFPHTVWGRGTASGGGMYPVEIYLVAGPSGPLLPGVYHYATGHHALERLLTGDVTPTVRAALGTADGPDHYLLASIRFWKNSFKYNSFCYHVVTQDLGALLGSWDLLGRALGVPLRRTLSFDPGPLDHLLGLDSDAESVFAVVPLPWAGTGEPPDPPEAADRQRAAGADPRSTDPAAAGNGPRVGHQPFERSRTVLAFPHITTVHRAAMAPAEIPDPDRSHDLAPAELAGPPTPLPAPELDRLDQSLTTVLRARRSSFGRFRRPPELTAAQVGTTLAFAAAGRRYPADVKLPDGTPELTRLWLFANHVDGLAPGTYAYRPEEHALLPAGPAPEPSMSAFLQQQYFLTNYTMGQVGAVLAISGRLDAVLAAYGPRGYRILNAEVGTVAQHAYCATTAQGIGCGAVLGFDNVAMNEALGIDTTDERTVLFLLLGGQPDIPADLAYHL